MAVGWIGLQSLLTGSDNSLFVRESVDKLVEFVDLMTGKNTDKPEL